MPDNKIKTNEILLDHFILENKNSFNDMHFISNIERRDDTLTDLKQMNVFVGANNSGKSRIIRQIFFQPEIFDLTIIIEFLELIKEFENLFNTNKIARGTLKKADQLCAKIEKDKPNILIHHKLLLELISVHTEAEIVIETSGTLDDKAIIARKFIHILNRHSKLLSKINKTYERDYLYIPALRGMRPFDIEDQKKDLYLERTKKDYFAVRERLDRTIFTGLAIYEDLQNKLLGNQSERDFVKNYETFLTKNFFDNEKITLIPNRKDDVVHINFDNNGITERALYRLGDGLQSIIITTYPIFLWQHENKDKKNISYFVCIEEPELYLHPSMQRKLIEVLLDKQFKNIQYFITTHSNHFLDLINDYNYQDKVSIYSVREKIKNKKIVQSENELSDTVYNLLGSRPSSLLLANKTIWVEGISDRIYIRHGLKLYYEQNNSEQNNKIPSEYVDYAFIEYSGSNLDHYVNDDDEQEDLQIESICNNLNVFLLADKDATDEKPTSKKAIRYNQLQNKLGDNFTKTHGREIENYLTPETLQKIYPEEILTLPRQSTYKNKQLAVFLNKKYSITTNIKDNKYFVDKQKFAKKAVKYQKSWEDLSREMQELINKIVAFIKT